MTDNPAPQPEVRPLTVPQTLFFGVAPLPPGNTSPPPLLVAMHGWGQNAKKILRDLAPVTARRVLVAAPQAPHPFYLDMGSGKVGFHWLTRYERDRAVADANAFVAHVLENLRAAHAYDPARVYLLGFSQGCSMAWRFCLSGHITPAGMIACGADLPPDVAEKLPAPKPFPVLLVHGREDTIIAPAKMHDAQAALSEKGVSFDVHEFDGGHEIPPAVAQHIADWIIAN